MWIDLVPGATTFRALTESRAPGLPRARRQLPPAACRQYVFDHAAKSTGGQATSATGSTLCQRPVARQISGVDLSDFLKNGKLTLITDRGTRIVWGSAIGDSVPGEVKVERKIARLEQNLKEFGRIDANQNRVEIYTPIVLVDKTAKAESGS